MIEEYEFVAASGPRIWAIGGGKGGVGKSVIAANLGASLAAAGARVVLVDADLGGANLHTLLGIPTPKTNLSDFVSGRLKNLADVVSPTTVEKLTLVSGAKALLEMANPKFSQKGKMLRHISALDADHVIIDLGAGSAFNVLDFFLVARRGILVVVPEATSVENAYHFLKAAFFRKLKRAQPRRQIQAAIKQVMAEASPRDLRTPRDLVAKVMAVDQEAGAALVAEASTFNPSLIVNRTEHAEHQRLGKDMSAACLDYFGIRLECLGTLPTDRTVPRSVSRRIPAAVLYGRSPFVNAIRGIAERLASLSWRSS